MFAKAFAIASTGIAAVQACVPPSPQFTDNPITAPTIANYPTIGQPFLITWDNTNQGPSVTLSLYNGCPGNCKEVTDIVGLTQNTGSYSWTPACTLTADETAEGYGILLIDDTLCYTQWSFHFGLHPDAAGVCSGNAQASSGASAAASSTLTSPGSTIISTAAAASSTTTLVPNPKTSKIKTTGAATSGSSPSSAAPSIETSTTYVAASPTLATSKTSAAAAPRATQQVMDAFVGAAALAAVALVI